MAQTHRGKSAVKQCRVGMAAEDLADRHLVARFRGTSAVECCCAHGTVGQRNRQERWRRQVTEQAWCECVRGRSGCVGSCREMVTRREIAETAGYCMDGGEFAGKGIFLIRPCRPGRQTCEPSLSTATVVDSAVWVRVCDEPSRRVFLIRGQVWRTRRQGPKHWRVGMANRVEMQTCCAGGEPTCLAPCQCRGLSCACLWGVVGADPQRKKRGETMQSRDGSRGPR